MHPCNWNPSFWFFGASHISCCYASCWNVVQHLGASPLLQWFCGFKTFVGFIKCRWKPQTLWVSNPSLGRFCFCGEPYLCWSPLYALQLFCILPLSLAIVVTTLVAMAPSLTPPRISNCVEFSLANTSQVPLIDIVVLTCKGNVQPTSHVGESNDIMMKSYDKNRQFQLLWLPLFSG